ncbi:MAG: hypothetical protein HC850_06690 [Rhodomicrobium sp.]|nr:hypothetical protein [Rhodomicrobium sp.]
MLVSQDANAASRNLDKAGTIMAAPSSPAIRRFGFDEAITPEIGPRYGADIKIWAQFRLLLFAAFVELSCYKLLFEMGLQIALYTIVLKWGPSLIT